VVVSDDGPGQHHAPAGQESGQGLRGMRDRAAAVGGYVSAGAQRTGWQTVIVVPLAPVTGSR
jgi:signal transduction histidine kinase